MSNTGAMCGGVINETLFKSDPMAYMMAWVMKDDDFAEYEELINNDKKEEAKKLFKEKAWSVI